MQRPREARQTQEGHNIPPREGQHNLDIPRGAETEAESSRARGYGSQLAPGEEGNGATLGGRVRNEELHHPQQGAGEQSWEHSFKSLQQELIRVKEVVRGRAPDTMDTLVQQTESPFTTEVLHFPLSAKFRMPQVEAFEVPQYNFIREEPHPEPTDQPNISQGPAQRPQHAPAQSG